MASLLEEISATDTGVTDSTDRWDRMRRMHGVIPGQNKFFFVSHNRGGGYSSDLDINVYKNLDSGASSWTLTRSDVTLTNRVASPWAVSTAIASNGDLYIAYTISTGAIKVAMLTYNSSTDAYTLSWEETALSPPVGYTLSLIHI